MRRSPNWEPSAADGTDTSPTSASVGKQTAGLPGSPKPRALLSETGRPGFGPRKGADPNPPPRGGALRPLQGVRQARPRGRVLCGPPAGGPRGAGAAGPSPELLASAGLGSSLRGYELNFVGRRQKECLAASVWPERCEKPRETRTRRHSGLGPARRAVSPPATSGFGPSGPDAPTEPPPAPWARAQPATRAARPAQPCPPPWPPPAFSNGGICDSSASGPRKARVSSFTFRRKN